MTQVIPSLAVFGIGRTQLLECVEVVRVGFDKLEVRTGITTRGRNILPRKPPVAMQHFALEPAEDRFDGLGLRSVRFRRAADTADPRHETQRIGRFLSALVVGNDLEGLVAGRFDGHAEGAALQFGILTLADTIAEHHLAVCVDHLIDHDRLLDRFPILVAPLVVEIQFRTVAIPQRIAHAGENRLLLAVELLAGGELSVHRSPPFRRYIRPLQVGGDRVHRFERLPPLALGTPVVLVEDLAQGIDRYAAATQGDEQSAALGCDLRLVRIAELL